LYLFSLAAQGRYSPAAVVAVSKEVVTGDPDQYISTGYVERQNLSLRMGQRQQGLLPPSFTQLAIAAIQARKDIPRIT
jgi:hypothetical protein